MGLFGGPLTLYNTTSGSVGYDIFGDVATQTISGASQAITVVDGDAYRPISSDAQYTLTAEPTIASGRNGQLVVIKNVGTDNIILQDVNALGGSNLRLTANTLTIQPGGSMGLIYDSTIGFWIEQYLLNPQTFTPEIWSFTVDGAGSLTHEWGDGSTANDTAPAFVASYVGAPSSASVTLTASPDPGYPYSLPSPYTSGTGPQYFRASTRNGSRAFRLDATVSGEGLTAYNFVTYRAPNYCGINTTSGVLNSAQINALTNVVLDTDAYGSYAVNASGVNYIWFAHVDTDTTPYFSIAGIRAQFDAKQISFSHTSTYLKVSNYDTYRSVPSGLGSVTVVTASTISPNLRYFGSSTSTGLLSEATYEVFGTTDILETLPVSKTIDGSGSKRAYMVFPSRLTTPTYLQVNSYIAGLTDASTQSDTNLYGYVETYRQVYANNTGLGNVSHTFTTSLPVNKTYGGPNSQSTALSSAQTIALDDSSSGSYNLTNNKYSSVTITTTAGEYAWYCYRSTLGSSTMNFGIDSERAAFSRIGTGTVSVTNEQGYVETFEQWRSDITNPTGGINRTIVAQASAFNNRFYMGPSTNGTATITTAEILSLDDTADGESGLYSTQARTWTAIKIEAGEYLWYCHPSSISDLATIKDGTTGFAVAGSYRNNISHTNDSGYTETYRCWRSDNSGIYPSGENIVVT